MEAAFSTGSKGEYVQLRQLGLGFMRAGCGLV